MSCHQDVGHMILTANKSS